MRFELSLGLICWFFAGVKNFYFNALQLFGTKKNLIFDNKLIFFNFR